jgi:hypothetical protein
MINISLLLNYESTFYQVPISEVDKKKIALITPSELYQFMYFLWDLKIHLQNLQNKKKKL